MDYRLIINSTLELGALSVACGMNENTLVDMYHKITGRTFSIAMQKSNWESNQLNQSQIDYATTQVKAGWYVFHHFRRMLNNNDKAIRTHVLLRYKW